MKSNLFLFCFLMFGIMASAQITTVGQMAYFPFNGNAQDQGPGAYQTTVYNAALTSDRFNVSNRAYYFNGTNANIELNSNFPDVTNLTICFWFKPDGTQSNDTGYIFWDGNGICGNDISIAYLNQKIYIRADKNGALLNGMLNQGSVDLSQINPAVNGWYHFAWVMEPNQSKIYVNGQYRSTASVSGSGVGAHFHPAFGCLNDGNSLVCGTPKGHFLKGSLDDILIYSNALTTGAIDTIFQLTSVNTGIETGLASSGTYLTIYPNPSLNGKLNIYSNIKLTDANSDIRIFNFIGEEFRPKISFLSNYSGVMDISELPNGIYIVSVYAGGNLIKTHRVTKGE